MFMSEGNNKEQNTVALRNKEQNIEALLEELDLTGKEMLIFKYQRNKHQRLKFLKAIKAYRELIVDPRLNPSQTNQARMMYSYSPEIAVRYMRSLLHYRETGRTIANKKFDSLSVEEKSEVVNLRKEGATIQVLRDKTGLSWRLIRKILDEVGVN